MSDLYSTIQNEGFFTTKLHDIINWSRKNSVWPMPMGISCCAIEMMAFAASRFDASRFGSEVFRFSPRQSDLMIVAGTVTYKMAWVVRKIWDQMPDPKYCMAMGACTSSGGMYRSYSVVQGIDLFIPVDVYVAGCPPRPDALIQGLIQIQEKISHDKPSLVK
jgi:NADH-quinone oxidoreductase subunit B